MNPNDGLNDATLIEDCYAFFSKCEKELLSNIVKRRQLKLRGIEANISEIKTLLQPYSNQSDYKIKERELQEIIKKYDLEIQAKKQKKFKREVLDYTNRKVYKWQMDIEGADEDPDEISLDDNPSDEVIEVGAQNSNRTFAKPDLNIYPLPEEEKHPEHLIIHSDMRIIEGRIIMNQIMGDPQGLHGTMSRHTTGSPLLGNEDNTHLIGN